ncbi:sensor histidine kinase [Actinomadura sp. 9N215]|uniref:sensor histidine kinase n=1 Tax=Actinomadura sp. 9N215 TaxID=3375150 RepID=UPI00378A447C
MRTARASRLSVRTRLTLVYGSLFLVTSAILVAVTYLLTVRTMDQRLTMSGDDVTPATFTRLRNMASEGDVSALVELKAEANRQVAEQKREVLEQLLQSSLITMLVLGVLAVAIGYVVAGRMLRPLHAVTATARRLSESNLHERIALDGPQDEIKDLADTFNRMLDRLNRAFDAQRRFVANASHELRTPLTINRTVLEVALASRRSPPETKALADVLLGNTARHERLIEGLLTLARSERDLAARTATPLPDVVRSALDHLDDRAEEAAVDVEARLAPAVVSGDPVLLERCAVNLLENAVKYNVRDGRVWVRTGVRDGTAFLQVVNTGRAVPSYEVGAIFEPFRRLRADRPAPRAPAPDRTGFRTPARDRDGAPDQGGAPGRNGAPAREGVRGRAGSRDRTGSDDGAGLGLSIVRAVVDAHGGTIETVPRDGGGLSITVRLPLSEQPVPAALAAVP